MSQFPIELDDKQATSDAVNYLLSGPGGLGQNFAGFSAYLSTDPADYEYLTGNFRLPFSQVGIANLYVPPISISNAEQLDNRTIKYYFAGAPLASVPFSPGAALTITGITPSTYNSSSLRAAGYPIGQIGVVQCTDSFVIVRTRNNITTPLGTYVSGGSATYRLTENPSDSFYNSTDCNARVTVTGGTDRVFISAQMTQTISYEVLNGPTDLTMWVAVRRYRGFPNNNPVNPDFLFDLDNPGSTVARSIYTFPGLTGTGTLDPVESVFATIVDRPSPGYFWYILEVLFEYPDDGTEIQVTSDLLGLRSLSAQVVKQ